MSARAVPPTPSAVSADTLRRLQEGYDLRNPDEILPYLTEHPELVPLLIDVRRQIDHFFTKGVPVSLSLETDPEDGTQDLFAVIRAGTPIEVAHERLSRFWNEWWDKQPPGLSWRLFFATL